MSTEAPTPDLPQINIFAVQEKGSNNLNVVMTTLTVGAWNSQNPELPIFGQRGINILGGLPIEDQMTFLQMIKVPAVARAFGVITDAFSSVANSALRSELESSDTRLRGELAMNILLKMFGADIISSLVMHYSRVYPVSGDRSSGIELERAARGEAPPVEPKNSAAPPAEEPRVLRPGVAETVSAGEDVRTEGGKTLRVDENFS